MNHMTLCDEPEPARDDETIGHMIAEPSNRNELVLRLRTVHRAASELRRGTPVILTGEINLVLLPAETAGAQGLAELAAIAATPPCSSSPLAAPALP